jgi:hypothetical protein
VEALAVVSLKNILVSLQKNEEGIESPRIETALFSPGQRELERRSVTWVLISASS